MKILHVIQTIDKRDKKGGGVTFRNLKLIEYLEKKNTQNFILTLNNKIDYEQKILPTNRVHFLRYYNERFPIPVPNIFKIAYLIKEVDIIHLTSFWTLLNVYSYLICKIFSKNYVICPAGALEIFGRSKYIKYIYKFLFGKNIINNSSALISITEKEKKLFISYGIPEKKIHNIPNGIDIKKDEETDEYLNSNFKLLNKKPYILFVGRLHYIKGPDLLLKAFELIADKIPNYSLLFAGHDDGLGQSLKDKANISRFSERIHFLGFVGGKKKDILYKNADILIIPSRSEAMSLVVLEAASFGVESIFTDQCGLDFLSNKNFGICVPAFDSKSISNALIKYLGSNKSKIKNKKLKDFVVSNFNWEKISEKYLKVFKECS